MTPEERFHCYIQAFNAGDWDLLTQFYAPGVCLVIGNGTELRGRSAIVAFYEQVRAKARRTIRVVDCFSDGHVLAAELESEFIALVDAPDFAAHPLRQGDRFYINSLALYDFDDVFFTRIRAATMIREYRPAIAGEAATR
jgi:hypothetical protein